MAKQIIRVFPRRTSLTPDDSMAFIGDPPFWRPEADEVHVSVTFTWDRELAERLAQAWGQYYSTVKLGGPAYDDYSDGFVPGFYVREGVIFTSRGCNKRCPWCLVPRREGKLRLLPIHAGWIINDNNLLQCPHEHQEKVYDMIRSRGRRAKFSGGLDATLVDDWVAEQLRSVPIQEVFLAADTLGSLKPLADAVTRLSFLRRDQLRCYVLLGYNGESVEDGKKRLETVWEIGCLPFAQLYQPPGRRIQYDFRWRALARTWSRPAVSRAAGALLGGKR